jgi:short-subunit dehydrogenase
MKFRTKLMMRLISNYVIPQMVNGSARRHGKALAITGAGIGLLLAGRFVIRRQRRYDLMGRTVLITGGSRGLGLVMAREFVRQGARVAICARDFDELERAGEDLMLRGGEVFPVSCDLTNQAEVEQLVHMVQEEFGEIDVLVNNAGVISVGPVEEMRVSDFEEAMRTNYWAAVYTILAVLPQMRMRRGGRIINIASIGAKISVPHLLPYCASKFAIMGLSAGLRAELAKDGIVVTTVCPGLMRTGSPRNAAFKGNHRAEYTWFSISDSLPLVSMSAERAARRIISACKRGDAEVVLSLPAKLAVKFNTFFPELTADLLGVVNQLLPPPGGIGAERARGSESESSLSPSFLTSLGDRAARANNQLGRTPQFH